MFPLSDAACPYVCEGEITKDEFIALVASGAMAEIELEDLRAALEPHAADEKEEGEVA